MKDKNKGYYTGTRDEVIAKGYDDCVAYMADGSISVAVAAPENGLEAADAAVISDIVTSQTAYDLSEVRIIEVN